MTDKKIKIWTLESSNYVKSAVPKMASFSEKAIEISSSTVTKNINSFLNSFLDSFYPLLESQEKINGSFFIDEIELNLVVNGKGGIELLGKLEVGAQAGIKVKLKKKS